MDSINIVPYIENEKLGDYARSCARLLKSVGYGGGSQAAAQLRACRRRLRRFRDVLQQRFGSSARVPAACEWLLDNWYMIQRECPGAEDELRRSRSLRRCRDGLIIEELCRALLQSGHGKLTEERCRLFLDAFQTVSVLPRRELYLFPAAMRAVLIAAVAQSCRRMQTSPDTEAQAQELSALFTSLRLLSSMDMESLLDSVDVCGAILSRDPGGDYSAMDRETKSDYLRRLEDMAAERGVEEHVLAQELIDEAAERGIHVGVLLYGEPKRGAAALYISANLLLTLFLSFWCAFSLGSLPTALLLLLPVSELVKGILDFALMHSVRPRPLPRMDMSGGVPDEGRSICVISVILGSCDPRRLEALRLASRREGRNLSFGLLADLPAAPTAETEADAGLLSQAREAVEALNAKYGGGFYLFTRPRSFDGEGYSGHERKRGALVELARLLCGQESGLRVTGDVSALKGTRYIITLDADTRIYPGSLAKLIGAALHPLCRPVIDGRTNTVVSGHAIIHPRIETELASANATDFSLIFAGSGGSDPYGSLCGELYMDAFDSGGFAGKGLIDAAALLRCTAGRFPEGRVLSHDALEGAYLRGAYMGDAEFSDAFPDTPLAYFKRQHRWIRGDWQNARWIFVRELADIDGFRLFDSLRRSLVPPATLAALLTGFFMPWPGPALAAWAALLALLSSLFAAMIEHGLCRRERFRLRRHTRVLTGLGGAIVRTFMRLWLLPFEAWVCPTAILTALWRMLISHRRLLQWQTFAQSGGGVRLSANVRAMWISVVLGVVLMAFSPLVIGKASGFMWLLSPAAAAALALPACRERELSPRDRELLLSSVNDSWQYLLRFSGEEDNFLPPDNFQEQPPTGVAHRTSPTNIGLALAAAAAAADCGIIARREASGYILRMLPTLERMPRHMGHFYNWYDTRSLRPLLPPYISTVDSGNLYAGLLVTAQALERWGEAGAAARLRALMEAMDFAPLYDRVRGLFHICYDTEKSRGSGGWYDLMASEAMLTSYIAVAKGDVPLRHWRSLSRAQLQKDGYRGLASWTGTMFEYLMPALFLPVYRASLLYESDRFCLFVQKRRHFPGKPWGISESAFYSLDASLSYRYKAHGCPSLALKRGQENDMVVSPYSSFLALAVDPAAAARNLRRLRDIGAAGRFGYIEALDFTPGRCRREDGEQVRCYMAHHVSMSILAAANAVGGNCVQELFMSEPDMAAYTLLLQEKLPDSGVVMRRDSAQVPERPRQAVRRQWRLRGRAQDAERACLLSNGAYSIRVSSTGGSAAFLGERCIYSSSHGGGLSISLDGRPLIPGGGSELWEFGEDAARWSFSGAGGGCTVSLSVAEGEWGQFIEVCLPARDDVSHVALELSLRPILAQLRDWESHSAYWKLGIAAEAHDGFVLLHRLPKGRDNGVWLCLACASPAAFSCDAQGRLSVRPGTQSGAAQSLRFALCLGGSAADAKAGAVRILASGSERAGCMPAAAALHLDMSEDELGAAMELVLPLWRNTLSAAVPQRALWQYGISGDLPLICCDGGAVEAEKLLKQFCLLKSCGLDAELVYLSDEQGEYIQPLQRRITQLLSSVGLEALFASPGGIFTAPTAAADIIKSRSAVVIGEAPVPYRPLSGAPAGAPRSSGSVPVYGWNGSEFDFSVRDSMPARIWQHMLTNGSLGAIAADFGPAGLWLKNAREMRLIAPPDDIYDVIGHERVYTVLDGMPVSLFAANDGYVCRVSYAPGRAVWEKELGTRRIRTTMFIPWGIDARILLVEGAEDMELIWDAGLCLGGRECTRTDVRGGCVSVSSAQSYLPGVRMLMGSGSESSVEADFVPAAVRLRIKPGLQTVLCCACCGEEEFRELCDPDCAAMLLSAVSARWKSLLGRFNLCGGGTALEHYMNSWAVYQTDACRLEGRSSIYQSGGAVGFRDQLQDSINLMLINPRYAREQILSCCRHQYAEGDVMHWWHEHPDGDRGVRTRCSDDLLWLVWALCEYVEATGDSALCGIAEPYISSPTLEAGEHDRYETARRSDISASVLDHAAAALGCCIRRGLGEHGLPYIGSGDWNDALDKVGGESVWLGWFLAHCAGRFSSLLRSLGKEGAEKYERLAGEVGRAADEAFNGQWYLRGWYSDGEPLGGGARIDSVAQSWAVLSGYASPERSRAALSAALTRLVDREHRIVKLLDPPYSVSERSPGYITGYGRGWRENGGQYTHGAIWLAMAAMRLNMAETGRVILDMLLPETHDLRRYEAEPYVLPADVSSAPGHGGLAGWTWYTGSAGWYFRAVTQELLGLRLRGGKLCVSPADPSLTAGCSVLWTDAAGVTHRIEYGRSGITLDGEDVNK